MEDFVTYELAVKLKEKGFRRPCILYYNSDKVRTWFNEPYIAKNFIPTTLGNDDVLAPTISQVLKWLREEKNFHLMVYILNDSSEDADGRIIQEWFFWSFGVQNCNSGDYAYEGDDVEYESYESAALAGIKYVLDNLI